MTSSPPSTQIESATGQSRRSFLKTTGTAAAVAALGAPRPGYCAEKNQIKIAIVGCGGRGTGALANALGTQPEATLWAMADVFPHRLEASLNGISAKFEKQVDVSMSRQFIGLDAYKHAIDSLDKGDVVFLTTPAGFRPIHFEYAVSKGVHVFMEKSFAVDAPGIRRLLRANEAAVKKNLKIAGGLMWRHDKPRQEVIRRIHDGAIGDLVLLRTYRMHGPVGHSPKAPDQSELAYQIANYNSFTWLNASFFVDWLIHNIDVCCWAKSAWPVNAQGHGARVARQPADQVYDQFMVEYAFPDGTRLLAEGRHNTGCWNIYSDFAHGTKGSAVIMQSLAAPKPRLYRNHAQTPENETWRYDGPTPNPYDVEHQMLFDAIRNDLPYNETERCARACMVAIMGRMAAESGQLISYDEALASNLELAPGLESLKTLDDPAPVQPDSSGRYPVPVPGQAKVL